jgi:alanine racemase
MSEALRAEARVDTGAIERNCRRLATALAPGAELCAVVKAWGYGHGDEGPARAALAGGASMLAVAGASEALRLRQFVADAPILTMGAVSKAELGDAIEARSELTVWQEPRLDEIAERGVDAGFRPRVHVKYDSGMGRLGERDPESVLALLDAAAGDERVELAALWTHFATADELEGPGSDYFRRQLERFAELLDRARRDHTGLRAHAANSAATLRDPASHFDMVRCGVAIYGLDPFQTDPAEQELEPALELRSYVADVKRFERGASVGYGRTWKAERETLVGVLPIGYGDGVRRALSNNAEVLVGGRRVPLVGTVSMDNITVDLGPDSGIGPGEEATLIGRQGEERILCEEVAARLGTINYEVTCGLTSRVPREYR